MTTDINWEINDLKGKNFSFVKIDELKSFAQQEASFWESAWQKIQGLGVSNVPTNIAAFSIWREIVNLLESWKDNFESWDQNTTNQQMRNYWRNWNSQLQSRWIWSGHDFVDAWINAYQFGQETGDGFFQAIQGQTPNTGSFNWLRGYILAYEFQLQDKADIPNRRTSEQNAFERARDEMTHEKNVLVAEVHGFKTGMEAWSNSIQNNYTSWFAEKQAQAQELHNQHTADFDKELSEKKSSFDSQLAEWTQRIEGLEHTYQDKLRLEKPAKYWADRAKKLRCQGLVWSAILAVVVICGIAGFSYLFTKWLAGLEVAFSLHSFQGAVLLTAIISSFVFAIRVTSRLAFSAFHLQRDAEEREQLTHVYLALANDAQPDAESRKIILQSLFSRAETGLLANEAGPTMPLGDIANAVSKSGRP